MKILVGHRGNVDFDEPLELDKSKRQEFIEFVKTLFDPNVVDLVPSPYPRWERIGQKNFQVHWDIPEYELLLGTDSNEALTEKLGRTWMSIVNQRGIFLPDFDSWCARNGYTRKGNYRELIRKYLEEKEFRKRQRRKRFQLLECRQCGILHLPEIYDQNECYSCGGRLMTIRVSPDEKLKLYKNQPRSGATPEFWKEFFEKYPPEAAKPIP